MNLLPQPTRYSSYQNKVENLTWRRTTNVCQSWSVRCRCRWTWPKVSLSSSKLLGKRAARE